MINLLSVLQKERFSPRFYIAAATDNMSLQKARTLEKNLVDEVSCNISFCTSAIFSLKCESFNDTQTGPSWGLDRVHS